jgi:hypothetical protein
MEIDVNSMRIFYEKDFEEGLPLAANFPSLSNNSLIAKSKYQSSNSELLV